jgi:hydroxymethylpyrimidine pyrophosphatase-like HAD family hydrolase
MMHKPLIFVDLDDTLFQTHRRIQPDASFRVATLDVSGQPLSFMKPKQQQLVDWMFHCADVVPVTARSVKSLQRVQLDFKHGAVCTHGGVVLTPSQQIDEEWQAQQKVNCLISYSIALTILVKFGHGMKHKINSIFMQLQNKKI